MTRILFRKTKQCKISCEFGHNGEFLVYSGFDIDSNSEMRLMQDSIDSFIDKYFSAYWGQDAENGFFFRFTNDKDEFNKIESGKYTNSVNHQDGRLESGISVSKNMSYASLGAYKYFYKVSGEIIGTGSDGEPILAAASIKKHSPYKSISTFLKNAEKLQQKKEADFLEEFGWTAEQLHDLKYQSLYHKCKIDYIGEDGERKQYSRWGSNTQLIEDIQEKEA